MTLEEAIKHCEEVAEQKQIQAENLSNCDGYSELECLECASEHRQLAEWLRELRAYREAYQNIKNDIHKYELDCRFADYPDADECVQCNKNVFGSIYKIIDKHIEEVNTDE